MLQAKKHLSSDTSPAHSRHRHPCISLIGMPGSGKSTLGNLVADKLSWAFVDTDHIMEAWYGLILEDIRDRLGRSSFLQAEEQAILSLNVNRSVIATGGSVIYSPLAMQALQNRGVLVYLQADYEVIEDRVALNPERGLILGNNQSLLDLYQERTPKYEAYADLRVRTDRSSLQESASRISEWFHTHGQHLRRQT